MTNLVGLNYSIIILTPVKMVGLLLLFQNSDDYFIQVASYGPEIRMAGYLFSFFYFIVLFLYFLKIRWVWCPCDYNKAKGG